MATFGAVLLLFPSDGSFLSFHYSSFVPPSVPPSLISVSSRRRTASNYHSIRLSRDFIKPPQVWCSFGCEFVHYPIKKLRESQYDFSGIYWQRNALICRARRRRRGGSALGRPEKLPEMDKFNWNRLLLLLRDHSGFDANPS